MEDVKSNNITKVLLILLRVISILLVIFLFIPGLNPARVSKLISDNMSLFTSGVVYSQLSENFGRCIKKGWVDQSTLHLLYASSLVAVIGVAIVVVGGCMTLGERKLKKLSTYLIAIGTGVSALSFVGMFIAYEQFGQSTNLNKIQPFIPNGYIIILIVLVIGFVTALVSAKTFEKPEKDDKYEMLPKYQLFLLLLPILVLTFVFSYLPLFGWRYGFFDYKPGQDLTWDKFVGFKWFTYLFQNAATRRDVIRVIKNTLGVSFLNIATSWMPMVFAIFLAEAKSDRFRRFVQIFTTIPNFISWVLVYAVAFAIFSTDGFLSNYLVNHGFMKQGVNYLMGSSHIWLKMLVWNLWKTLGWNAIIYIAAISGIDQQLYEAATVDGAGRFQRMWNVTVPGLMPTFCVLLLLAVAGILNNGMDQFLVFENTNNTSAITVLDLYVYKLGIGNGVISLSTVVSMSKSIISVTLLFVANRISKAVRGESIV